MPGFSRRLARPTPRGALGDQARALRQEVFEVLDVAFWQRISRRRHNGAPNVPRIALETAYLLLSNIGDTARAR
jgi:hypothetical protein